MDKKYKIMKYMWFVLLALFVVVVISGCVDPTATSYPPPPTIIPPYP